MQLLRNFVSDRPLGFFMVNCALVAWAILWFAVGATIYGYYGCNGTAAPLITVSFLLYGAIPLISHKIRLYREVNLYVEEEGIAFYHSYRKSTLGTNYVEYNDDPVPKINRTCMLFLFLLYFAFTIFLFIGVTGCLN